MWQSKNIIKKNVTMVFYNEKEQLYLQTDVLDVSWGVSLIQVRDGMHFPRNEVPYNAALQPVAFARKSLTSMESHYNNREKHLECLMA